MSHVRSLIALILLMVVCALPLVAQAGVRPVANPRYASLIIDADTGNVLHAENANAQRYPASLTKMMTLYLLFEALRDGKLSMDTMLPVSKYAASKPQTNLFLRGGDQIPVRDAILALIIRSANDVAVVVGERLGRSEWEFAKMMTRKARELGMNSTVFRNANGLPDSQQHTTARDMAVLAMALKKHFPQYYPLFKTMQFSYKGRTYYTHNNVMKRLPGTEGLKTGFINASGFNVVTSVVRNGHNLVGVVMGGRTGYTRDTHMIKLMEEGFVQLARGSGDAQEYAATTPPAPHSAFARIPLPVNKPVQLASKAVAPLIKPAPMLVQQPPIQQQPVASTFKVVSAPTAANQQYLRYRDTTVAAPQPVKQWAIQVGAYSGAPEAVAAANNASQLAMNELAGAQIMVSDGRDVTSGQEIHRARLANLDQSQAHQACQKLIAMQQSCFVIKLD